MPEKVDSSHLGDTDEKNWRTCGCLGCMFRRASVGMAAAVDEPKRAPESSRADRPEASVIKATPRDTMADFINALNGLRPGIKITIDSDFAISAGEDES